MSWKKNLLFIGLIALAMLTRFLPHPPNFTAVTAAALFGGFVFSSNWKAFLIPLITLFMSDLLINNTIYAGYYDSFVFFTDGFVYIYAATLLCVVIGKYAMTNFKAASLLGGGIAASVLFYMITNFGVWASGVMYPLNFGGLMTSYAAGLPFLFNQVASTLLYGAVLFGAAYLLRSSGSASVANA